MLLFTERDAHETDNKGTVADTGLRRERPDPQTLNTNNVVTKLSFTPGERHRLTLGLDRFDSETDTWVLSDYGIVSRGTTTDRRDAEDERIRTRLSLAYGYNGDLVFADQIQANLYSQRSETQQMTREDRTTPRAGAQSRSRMSFFDQHIDGAYIQFGKTIELGDTQHLLTYGTDFYRTDNAGLRNGATFDSSGAPVREFFPFPTRDFPPTEVEQVAVFLQDEIAFLDGRLLISPGVRYDSFDANATADPIFLSGNPGSPIPEDYKDAQVTAKIGAVYAFSDGVSAFARFSEGFRAPPYDDVNVGFTNFIGGYKTVFQPQSSIGTEYRDRTWRSTAGSCRYRQRGWLSKRLREPHRIVSYRTRVFSDGRDRPAGWYVDISVDQSCRGRHQGCRVEWCPCTRIVE